MGYNYCLRGCWYEVMSSELLVDAYGLVGYWIGGCCVMVSKKGVIV